jgi:hypothetical protein
MTFFDFFAMNNVYLRDSFLSDIASTVGSVDHRAACPYVDDGRLHPVVVNVFVRVEPLLGACVSLRQF